ncbi:MAG: N-formylglutamate amidohydrolase [Gammaproteobacteria bacterium]
MISDPSRQLWIEERKEGPLLATAIHAGHEIRGELFSLLALDEAGRAREEDPYTDYWVKVVPSWLVPTRSRFEADLNRARDEAVYRTPEMAWGLHLWKQPPAEDMIERSLEGYDAFYQELASILDRMAKRHKRIVIFDLHAYNHRRGGPREPPADPETHPEVNIGTGSMNRKFCGHIVDRFIDDLRRFDFLGRHLDVRENVKFKGRHLAHWIHSRYPNKACVIAVEFKKFFMDEWTGVGDVEQIEAIRDALQSTLPGILEELKSLECKT